MSEVYRPDLTIVVAVKNNQPSLDELYQRTITAFDRFPSNIRPQILFVDDGSNDGSNAQLEAICRRDNRCRLLTLSRSFGQHAANLAGIKESPGSACVIMAADLQDPPELLPTFVEKWRSGNEIVIAYRSKRQGPWPTRALSKLAFRILTIGQPQMPPGGFDFGLIGVQACRELAATTSASLFIQGELLRMSYPIAFVPYEKALRPHGISQHGFSSRFAMFINGIQATARWPARTFMVGGTAITIVGLFSVFLPRIDAFQSFVITILGLSAAGIGLLLEIAQNIYTDSIGRQLYVVETQQPDAGVDETPSLAVPINQPALPDFERYVAHLKQIWHTHRVSNNGPLVRRLESELADLLGVAHVVVVSSGTAALQLAFHVLNISRGSAVLTTPYSHRAAVDAIHWEGLTTKFADIETDTHLVHPTDYEAQLDDTVSAILPVHLYGHACDVDAITKIAEAQRVPVIFDAAQSLGTTIGKTHLAAFGTLSILSLHATKYIHCGEGGAICTNDHDIAKTARQLRDAGHGPSRSKAIRPAGNFKISEIAAALGLENLRQFASRVRRNRELNAHYDDRLLDLPLTQPQPQIEHAWNAAFKPIVFTDSQMTQRVQQALADESIESRRYFCPSLNQLAYTASMSMPHAESLSARTLCLPIFPDLDPARVDQVCDVIYRTSAP